MPYVDSVVGCFYFQTVKTNNNQTSEKRKDLFLVN